MKATTAVLLLSSLALSFAATPILLVPGAFGSIVLDNQGDTLWFTLNQLLLNSGSPNDLKANITWNTVNGKPKQGMDTLQFTDPVWLASFENLFGGYYGFKLLYDTQEIPIIAHVFDWRRDLSEHVESLAAKITTVYNQYGPIPVMAHSIGGLILYAALQKHAQLKYQIQSVTYSNVPFMPNTYNVNKLYTGWKAIFNDKLLASQTLFTFASSYAFFPLASTDNTESDAGFYSNVNGQPIYMDMYNVNNWVTNKWGYLAQHNLSASELTHLTNSLSVSKTFRQSLPTGNNGISNHPPCAVIAGDGFETEIGAVVNPDFSNYMNSVRKVAVGDDVISYLESLPPASLGCKVYNSSQLHYQTFLDVTLLEQIACDLGHWVCNGSASPHMIVSSMVVMLVAILLTMFIM